MIELRFIERYEDVPTYDAPPMQRLVRVLQYREPMLPFRSASGDISAYENPNAEWTDVPLVVQP